MAKAYGMLLRMPDGTERPATAHEIARLERQRAALREAQEAWDTGHRGDGSQQAFEELFELALAGDLDAVR